MTRTRSLILGLLTLLFLTGGFRSHINQLRGEHAFLSPAPVKPKEAGQIRSTREEQPGLVRPPTLPIPPPPGLRSFTGRVVKVGTRYVLKDALVDATYDIDPQAQVTAFAGMMVRLNGTLDSSGTMIRLKKGAFKTMGRAPCCPAAGDRARHTSR